MRTKTGLNRGLVTAGLFVAGAALMALALALAAPALALVAGLCLAGVAAHSLAVGRGGVDFGQDVLLVNKTRKHSTHAPRGT